MPGFGHTIGNLGSSFQEHAKKIADELHLTTAITVPDIRDETNMLMWTGLSGLIQTSINGALLELNRPSHLIAFSRSASEAIKVATRLPARISGDANLRKKQPTSQVLSLTLCAPVPWDSLHALMKPRGFRATQDQKGPLVTMGSRGTKGYITLKNLPESLETITQEGRYAELTLARQLLEEYDIPFNILTGSDDPVVHNLPQHLARDMGQSITVIDTQGVNPKSIHDFADPVMFDRVLATIKENLITQPREFAPPHISNQQ